MARTGGAAPRFSSYLGPPEADAGTGIQEQSFISEVPLGNTGRGDNKMNKERKVQVKGVTKQVTTRA